MSKETSKNKVYINEYGVVEIVVFGNQTADSVTKLADEADKLVAQQRTKNKPGLVLDNLMLVGKVPTDARRIVVEKARSSDYDRLAFVGNDTLVRLGANLILQAIGKAGRVKYFDDYGEAINWLTDEA